jgi:hypothetical protein
MSQSLHPICTPEGSTPLPILPSLSDKQLTPGSDTAPCDNTFLTSSQILPPSCESTYGSHELVPEIAEFPSSPLNAATLDIASSPPSSSPSQIFSSSPLASSQASEPPDDSEPEKSDSISNEVGPLRSSGMMTDFRSFRYYQKTFRMKQIAT